MLEARLGAAIRAARVCAAIAALGLGCGIDADRTERAASPATTCATVAAAGPWWNQAFPEQRGRFHVELDATPSAHAIDAVIGFGDGAVASFARLAAGVRFSPAGVIDVRAGAGYRADRVQPYAAGTTYHLRLDVDVRSRTYSVWLRDEVGVYAAIARDYPFRTEQAAVARLTTAAAKVDSAAGALEVCGLAVVADATTADGCVIAAAGDGFATVPLPAATVLDTLVFSATPSGPGIDAVIGLSAGPATGFSSLATAVRFAPSGVVDVRDGDGYRADVPLAYDTARRDFRVIADLTSHTYSVFEGVFHDARQLARQYRFRSSQAAVTRLDHLALIVDGAHGSVTVCHVRARPSTGVVYSREGYHAVLPLAGDHALLSDGATTRRVDAAGRTIAEIAIGGELAIDLVGNMFVARVDGTTLSVDKLAPGFVPRWRATLPVLAGGLIRAVSTDPSGAVLVGIVTPQEGSVSVTRFTAGGVFASQLWVSGEAVALDGDQPIVAWNDSGTLRITRFAATGATVWSRAFTGHAAISAITSDPGHAVVFGGELFTPIDFGGGVLPTRSSENGPRNGFVVKLSPAGEHVFSQRTDYTQVEGIASNGPRIVVSSTERTQFHYLRLQMFDAAGMPLASPGFDPGFDEHGIAGPIAISATGRVWWNLGTQWPLFPIWPYLVVGTP